MRQGLVQLRAIGVEFSPLPLDFCYVSRQGKLAIAAHFPVSSVKIATNSTDFASFNANLIEQIMSFLLKFIRENTTNPGKVSFSITENPFFIDFSQLHFADFNSESRLLGKGGFGAVYLNKLGNEEVSVKVVKYTPDSREKVKAKVMKELRHMVDCQHTNIVRA